MNRPQIGNSLLTFEGIPVQIERALPDVRSPLGVADMAGRICVDGRAFSRQGKRLRIQGATYGPFAPDLNGAPFPMPARIYTDFEQMQAAGINTVRLYHTPTPGMLEIATACDMSLLVDIAWPKDMCFLESETYRREAREAVRNAVRAGHQSPALFAYSIGNEIAPDIVRWQGATRVEKFLAELYDVAKQNDPDALVTYANFPSTEYLDLSFLDFETFNVYLHDLVVFRRYLVRLLNRIGDRPLLLGEIGMDTLRHGQEAQAEMLHSHLREASLLGLAGAFVFSWTDDWFTHGYAVDDWAFGITERDRTPKASYEAVSDIFTRTPSQLLEETPRVSVVVCSYNGGRTLDQCLRSLEELDYPNYEVILVDDGSTDDTPAISARFPDVQTIRQENAGLSVARNVGLQAATGEIVAYTDSDCFADSSWLTCLVHSLQYTGAAGVGGPNLTPDDGWLVACIAASPGQPTHVLASDLVAEHVPGCNMAFRKEALVAVNGCTPIYRKAGDDVDLCWRLQQAGYNITFAPGAFVWHHRRQDTRAYLKQQMGYGDAEAILCHDHPERFNLRGESKWEGNMYGGSLPGLRLGQPIIYSGIFGAGLFQTLYQPATSYWPLLPNTLEWLFVMLLMLAASFRHPLFLGIAVAMAATSVAVSLMRAAQAPLLPRYRSLKARLMIALLCQIQPLARGWRRYRGRLFPPYLPRPETDALCEGQGRYRLLHRADAVYYDWHWHERDRIALLDRLSHSMSLLHWGFHLDTGWKGWDFAVRCHPWTSVEITTAREAGGLFRVRYRLRVTEFALLVRLLAVLGLSLAVMTRDWLPCAIGTLTTLACILAWWRGTYLGGCVRAAIDKTALELGLTPFIPGEPLTPGVHLVKTEWEQTTEQAREQSSEQIREREREGQEG